MRVGLIGLGRIGAFHARTLSELPVVESLVVADPVPAAVQKVTTELGGRVAIEAAESPAELLAAGVNGVLIAAATDAHPELLVACVDAGRPAFCKKPLNADIDDAVALARRVAGRDGRVQVGYPAASTLATAPPGTRCAPATWAGCTPCGPPRWTPRHHRWRT